MPCVHNGKWIVSSINIFWESGYIHAKSKCNWTYYITKIESKTYKMYNSEMKTEKAA